MIVEVTLRNRRAYFTGKYPRITLQEFFCYRPVGYQFMPQFKRFFWDSVTGQKKRVWDGYLTLLKHKKVGTGLFLGLKEKIEQETSIRFRVDDRRRQVVFKKINMDGARPYQIECFEKMKEALSGGIVLGATGTGKTRIAGMFFESLWGSAVFVVDELTLLDQSRKALSEVVGEEVGKIGDQEFDPKRITVATIQTLHRYRNSEKFQQWVETLEVIVIDELHLQLNRRNFDVVADLLPKRVFGLTATLEMKKEHVWKRALNLCGPVIFDYGLEKGTQEGYLTPGIVVSLEVGQRDDVNHSYMDGYRSLIVNSSKRNRLVEDIVRESHKRGHSIIVLVERVKHLHILSELLEDVSHRLVYGAKSSEYRTRSKKKFDQGKIRLIIANKVFQKGVDIKAVDVIVDGAGLKSKNNAIQKYGRGVRLCEGKEGLLYFDISDRPPEKGVYNRFSRATTSRLKAFKSRKIRVETLEESTECDSEDILVWAEKRLKKEIRRRNGE